MSKLNFLPQQEKIISLRDKNMIVSASAGSGKTTIMIEKIVRLLLDGQASLDSILVLTYTKSAASDMKAKLEKSLKEADVSQEVLDKLDNCDISTIHSFCQKQLKRFFSFSNLDFAFDIVDDSNKVILKERALKQTLEQFKSSQPQKFFELLKLFKNGRSEAAIKKLVYAIEEFLSSIVDKEKERKIGAFNVYNDIHKDLQVLNGYFVETANMFKLRFEGFAKQCEKVDALSYVSICNQIISLLENISINFDYFQNLNNIYSISLPVLKKVEGLGDLTQKISKEKSSLSKFLSEAKSLDFTELDKVEESFSKCREYLTFLLEIEEDYERQYEKLKQEQNLLDFSDLEIQMLKLLKNPEVATALKEKYKYIFVDEFQDANNTQEQLISALSGQNNRFMVGDVKQSIYGFRRSKPEIFLEKEREYVQREDSEALELNVNFRSDKNILQFVNSIFSVIMTKDTCGIDYKQKSEFIPFVSLDNKDVPHVKILIANKQEKISQKPAAKVYSVKEHIEEEDEFSYATTEADLVAQEILNLYDKEMEINGEFKKIGFSDISILVRKRGDYFEKFCSRLIELGVPIYASSNQNLLDENEVKKLVALLKLALNFEDEYSLVTVMLSPFGDFDECQLAKIKTLGEKERFCECLFEVMKKEDDFAQKTRDFVQKINKFAENIELFGAFYALNQILRECNVRTKLSCLVDGENKLSCIDKFLSIVGSSGLDFNLAKLIEFFELENGAVKAPDFFVGETDCVNITTIHASKGLEYPIVFLVDAGNNFMKSVSGGDLEINEKLGIALKINSDDKYSNLATMAIKLKNQSEEFAERLRLLYVGMTRAKNSLFIFGSSPLNGFSKINSSLDVLSQKSYLSLIVGSLDKNQIEKIANGESFETELFQLFCFDNVERQKPVSNNFVAFGKYDDDLVKKIEYNLGFVGDFNKLPIALKNSVSTLVSMENDYVVLEPKKFTINEQSISSHTAEIGTLYHNALEILDFNKIESLEDVEKSLGNQFSCLDFNKLYNCCIKLKNLFNKQEVFKEKKFIMRLAYNEVVESEKKDDIVVQGMIDCFSKSGILVDYKYTKLNADGIRKRYCKQLELYKKALELGYDLKNVKCYILKIDNAELIEINL